MSLLEYKKNPKASVHNYTGLYFVIGLAISMSVSAVCLNWRFYERGKVVDLGSVSDNFEEVREIPQTEQPPPKPPKKVQPEIVEVPDDEEIEEEVEIDLDIQANEETQVEDPVFSDEPKEEKADKIFQVVQEKAKPKGGMSSFYNYVHENLEYPDKARRMGIEGKVYVQFVVEKNGKITNVEVLKGIGHGCDKEAVRILKNAPEWEPGKQRGRPVRVRRVLPITFKLED